MIGILIGAALLALAAWILLKKIRAFTRSGGQSGCDACPYCQSCRKRKH